MENENVEIEGKTFYRFDNSIAVKIDDIQREEWIEQMIQHFKNKPETEYNFIRSGDSMVLCCWYNDKLEILDCIVRTSYTEV